MSRPAKYIVAIVLLLVANLWLFLSGFGGHVKISEKFFKAEDMQSVSEFRFAFEKDTVKITKTGQGWVVNDQYMADQGFVNTLISVLERVEVGGSIGNWERDVSGRAEVEFDFNSKYRYQFQFAANPNKTRSYFITDGEAREVSVPGYRDNVVDIFILHPDQWRDRTIIDGNWRTIQNLEVKNDQGENFKISFSDTFFLVNDEQPTDSSAVVNYLNQFRQFQVNEMISLGRFKEMDSIANTKPFAQMVIDDLKNQYPVTLQIFPNTPGQAYHLVVDQDGHRMVIDARRVTQILTNPDNQDFTKPN